MQLKSKEYCLHDTLLSNIVVEKFGLALIFEKGIYSLSREGKEDGLTSECVVKISIDNFKIDSVLQHLQIFKQRKNRIKEISIRELQRMILMSAFIIEDTFWSDFSKGLIIKGNVNKFFVELKITEINTIEYLLN